MINVLPPHSECSSGRIHPCSSQTLIRSPTGLFGVKSTSVRGNVRLREAEEVRTFLTQKPPREEEEITQSDEENNDLSPLIWSISFVISVLLLLIVAILTAIQSKRKKQKRTKALSGLKFVMSEARPGRGG